MRVLHIYSGNLFGGIESMLLTIARYQHFVPGTEHHFALCFKSRLSESLQAIRATIHHLGEVRTSRPLSVLRGRRRLRSVLTESSYDVVICHSPWAQAVFGPEVRQTESLSIFWLHGQPSGRHWLERWASQTRPDLAICNSRFTAASLNSLYPSLSNEVLYCPVAPPERSFTPQECLALRQQLDTRPDAIVIIQVSRLEEWKGQSLLLDALSLLVDLPNWVCWQVGAAQRPKELRYSTLLLQRAALLGIKDRVRFLGERTDVPFLLASSDIFCQPNTRPEPFGISFIESLYAGCPVVTTATGGAIEIVDDTCGSLVPNTDRQLFSDVLRRLVFDTELRSGLSEGGPSRATGLCNPANQLQKLSAMLKQACIQKEAA